MADTFEAVQGDGGRLRHFVRNGAVDAPIRPQEVGELLDGGERVTLDGQEYDLGINGTLVHLDVEIIESVLLGSGVRVDEGTVFHPPKREIAAQADGIVIGPWTRIGGTEIRGPITIGRHALILARKIASGVTIGEGAELRKGVEIQKKTTIGEGATIGENAQIANEVTIGMGATLSEGTRLYTGVTVGTGAHVTVPSRSEGNQGGPLIARYKVIEAGAKVES